ncbi:MAG: hypothetical protein WCL05_06460 [Verrucomicrobiota bacterium]|jgi:hypothetical protein
MAPRHLLLALGSFLAVSLGAQVAVPAPAPPPTVTVRTSVSHLDPKTGKSDSLTAPSVSVISGSEARVSVAGRPDPKDPKGQPQGGMELVIAPTVQPDGTVSISLRVVISAKVEPVDPKQAGRERKRDSKAYDGTLTFYSVLSQDGLFSIQDSKGGRRWYKLGSQVDGWTLESYDKEKEMLVVGQGATHQELRLYKSSIEASASELNTVVTVRPGEIVKVPGVGGLEVSVSASVSATPVVR